LVEMPSFKRGWNPDLEGPIRQNPRWSVLLARELPFAAAPAAPIPPSFSLTRFRRYPFDQGQAGTCWVNAAVQMMQVHTAAGVEVGHKPWEITEISRRFAAYWGKIVDGTYGNPDDGGVIGAALMAMSNDPAVGKGTCHEPLWPSPPGSEDGRRTALARRPHEEAGHDARANRVSQVYDLRLPLGDDARRSILNGC